MKNSLQLILIFFAALFLSIGTKGHCEETYMLSMLPRYSPEEILSRITPLCEYLSKKLGVQIVPVVTRDFDEYSHRIRRGEIGLGYENPYIYALVSSKHEVLARAVKGKDGNSFRGVIIARTDSGINEISDLKGKTVSIVGKTSTGGFLSQKATLHKHGFNLDRDLTLVEALDNKQENVLLSVYYGDVDAGFIRESALHIVDNYIAPTQIKVIEMTEWMPNWAISINRDIPQSIKAACKAAILALKKNDIVLNALKITKFKKTSDADYDVIRMAAGLPVPNR